MKIWGTGLLNGLRITMRNMLRGPITVQYPKEKVVLPERARWAVTPKYDEAGVPKCTACGTCVKACPDFVLSLDVTTDPDSKAKHIDHFGYQLGACMMCGLCVESCPFDAIEMGHDYELARTSPDELNYDLLTDVDAYKPKRPERPAAAAKPVVAAPAAGPQADAAAQPEAPVPPADSQKGGDE